MAFLVCYTETALNPSEERAIYLDQRFYELIFRTCRGESAEFNLLAEIACLRYKSPTMPIDTAYIPELIGELSRLENSDRTHPQISEFKKVCESAIANNYNLAVSGDMHPEL